MSISSAKGTLKHAAAPPNAGTGPMALPAPGGVGAEH